MSTEEYLVDLHLHSKHSRATSKNLDLAALYYGAKIKGIQVLGTGDFTHPIWFEELTQNLVLGENGLYQLKPEVAEPIDAQVPVSCQQPVYFIPTVEICCIYRRHDRLRKLHNVVVMPTLKDAARLNNRLSPIGNLQADGRPILGIDSYDLLKICLNISSDCLFIPAHIWTPWFGMFGSQSGFDSLQEAFGDLAGEIYAVETGLSSDPPMNWRLSELQQITLVSHSDAHSAAKLGREANVLKGDISYQDVLGAIRSNDDRFVGTVEFFPEEGKYHADGHRKCQVRLTPEETNQLDGLCPVCKRSLTIGVLHRVDDLANTSHKYESSKTCEYIVPLAEILAQLFGVKSVSSKKVVAAYNQAIAALGDEFSILRSIPIAHIRTVGMQELASLVEAMRNGKIEIDPGYDGVYGTVKIMPSTPATDQMSLL